MHSRDNVTSRCYGSCTVSTVGELVTGISGGTLVTIIDAILAAQGEPQLAERMEIALAKPIKKKRKRKASASSKKYGRAFKRLAPKFKKKNGSWKKDGFKRCVKAAHKECRVKVRRKHR